MNNQLAALLEETAVCLNYPAKEKADVIAHLAERLWAAGHVKESYLDAVLTREAKMPTGLPLGGDINAAIPHADVEHVIRPAIGIATLTKPVIFQEMVDPDEAVPVRLVFLMAITEPKAQVEMLQEIAALIQQPDIVNQLVKAQKVNDVQMILAQL